MRRRILFILTFVCVNIFANSYHGMASYYTEKDNRLNGHNKTSNGEYFNENSYTCASNKHKFGTVLRVENVSNGKVVHCRVNDRGGFHKYGRTLDLSKRSFQTISSLKRGVVKVKITPVR